MFLLGYMTILIMGILLGIAGGGGSILTVPVLVYLFSMNPLKATHHSLFVVGLTALVGAVSYHRRNEVDLKTGSYFAIPSFFGVFLARNYLLPSVPEKILEINNVTLSKEVLIMTIFAIVMLVASFSMIKSAKNKSVISSNEANHSRLSNLNTLKIIVQGVFVGVLTGFVGAGGGFVIIPALVLIVGMRMKVAIGTSLTIIAANSLLGFFTSLIKENSIDWGMLLVISAVAFIGMFIGIKLSNKISEKKLKLGFGIFVLCMGVFVLIDQILRMKQV